MIHRTRAALLLASTLCAGCVTVRPPDFLTPAPERAWTPALAEAQTLEARGRPASADSVLATYAARYPASREAAETNYWRGLFRFDSTAVSDSAIKLLQAYVSSSEPRAHDFEAHALLRIAFLTKQLNGLRDQAVAQAAAATAAANDASAKATAADGRAAVATAAAHTAADDAKARDDTIGELKKELADANTELDRIKKRLGDTPKKPPTSAKPPTPTPQTKPPAGRP